MAEEEGFFLSFFPSLSLTSGLPNQSISGLIEEKEEVFFLPFLRVKRPDCIYFFSFLFLKERNDAGQQIPLIPLFKYFFYYLLSFFIGDLKLIFSNRKNIKMIPLKQLPLYFLFFSIPSGQLIKYTISLYILQ